MNTAPPYPPSWLDRFAAWVERQPGPPWIIYAALGAAGYLATSVLRWLDGRQPVGAFDPLPPPSSTSSIRCGRCDASTPAWITSICTTRSR